MKRKRKKKEKKKEKKKRMGNTNWDETLDAPAVSRHCHPVSPVSPERCDII